VISKNREALLGILAISIITTSFVVTPIGAQESDMLPGAPRLQSPLKYRVINTTTPTLTWTQEDPHNVIQRNAVHIEYSDGVAYESLFDATISFTVPDGYLMDGVRYSWAVAAINDAGEVWSQTWWFTVDVHGETDNGKKMTNVAIIVDKSVALDTEANLNQYIEDVNSTYNFKITQYNSTWTDCTHLRAFIQNLYNNCRIDGAILVGNLPYALWEFFPGDIGPLPFYYEDMDGTFEDRDSNGVFDHYT